MQVPTHGPLGIQTGTAHGVEPTLRVEDYDEACFLNWYWPGFFAEGWTRRKERGTRYLQRQETNANWTSWNKLSRYNFPMTRYDTTMTVLANNTTDSWEGAVDEEEHYSGREEGLEKNDEYLDALATAQEDEAEAFGILGHSKQNTS